MKKLLILIVFAAVFLHFYPQEELTNWYEDKKDEVIAIFDESTDTRVRLKPTKIYQDLTTDFKQFKTHEQAFVKEITQSREKLLTFYREYCETRKASAHLHASNQELVCQSIARYQSLM